METKSLVQKGLDDGQKVNPLLARGNYGPDGLWYKDFGSFKICGDGRYPKTFLLAGQPAKGQKL